MRRSSSRSGQLGGTSWSITCNDRSIAFRGFRRSWTTRERNFAVSGMGMGRDTFRRAGRLGRRCPTADGRRARAADPRRSARSPGLQLPAEDEADPQRPEGRRPRLLPRVALQGSRASAAIDSSCPSTPRALRPRGSCPRGSAIGPCRPCSRPPRIGQAAGEPSRTAARPAASVTMTEVNAAIPMPRPIRRRPAASPGLWASRCDLGNRAAESRWRAGRRPSGRVP